jgi:membrane protein YqaA with SNARE-associated domain
MTETGSAPRRPGMAGAQGRAWGNGFPHYNGRLSFRSKSHMIESAISWLLLALAAPQVGLASVFIVCFVSATLLPLGSEPAVFAVVKANPAIFWTVILVATLGNTLGGALDYWMGLQAKATFAAERETRWFGWLERFGPKTMLLAWLPGIGDPICTLAGWLRLPFWPSVAYMALGKFLRYVSITGLLMTVSDSAWLRFAHLLG